MEKKDWNKVRHRLRVAVDQGMKFLKEGANEARYVAGQTAHVIQLEMDILSLKGQIADLTHALGKEVNESGAKITPKAREMSLTLTDMKEEMKKKEKELQKSSVVKSALGKKNGRKTAGAVKKQSSVL